MLVVDTNFAIRILRKHPLLLRWLAEQRGERLVMPIFVVLELLKGCKNDAECAEVEQLVKFFTIHYPSSAEYARAAEYLKNRRVADQQKKHPRQSGLSPIDALVAACASVLKAPLCTLDKDFDGIKPPIKVKKPYSR